MLRKMAGWQGNALSNRPQTTRGAKSWNNKDVYSVPGNLRNVIGLNVSDSLLSIYIYTHTHTHTCIYITLNLPFYIYIYIAGPRSAVGRAPDS